MLKLLIALSLFYSLNAFSQDSLSIEKIDKILYSHHHGKFLGNIERAQDTIIIYGFNKVDTSFMFASCYKRRGLKRTSNDLIFDFHYFNDHLIQAVVSKWKRKNYSVFYFYNDKVIKELKGGTMPEINVQEILEKSHSILSKKEKYKPKHR